MKELSVFEGKNKFSEVVANAAKGEPQLITKNGTATAVVISFGDIRRPSGRHALYVAKRSGRADGGRTRLCRLWSLGVDVAVLLFDGKIVGCAAGVL